MITTLSGNTNAIRQIVLGATSAAVATVLCAAVATPVAAGPTDEQRCFAGRAKAYGKLESCIQNDLAKGILGSFGPNFQKCREKFDKAWEKLVILAGTDCALAHWVDNGNGSVTDNRTGLVWQKSDDASGLTDKDNAYTWTDTSDANSTDEDGTAFTDFLTTLNAATFGGANGWRLPTLTEVQTIVASDSSCALTLSCVDEGLFGPINDCSGDASPAHAIWTSTTGIGASTSVWVAGTSCGIFDPTGKAASGFVGVRAVRNGL